MDSRPVWGPTVRGPIVRFLEVDNWAPDSWARGPTVRGPVVRFLEVDNWALDSWAPGPTVRGPTVRGPTVRGPIHRGPICLEPFSIQDIVNLCPGARIQFNFRPYQKISDRL